MRILQTFEKPIRAAIIGASGGIGSALTHKLAEAENVEKIYAFSRSNPAWDNPKITASAIDITDESTIEKAAQSVDGPLHLILVTTGLLHADTLSPEKALKELEIENFQKSFAVNTFGPALVAKHFLPLIPKEERSVFAAMSARVGSISDNKIGGWYAYRAAKTALNMLLKTTAIEIGRRYKQAAIIGLHPGTVDTALSKPFQNFVQHEIFTPDQAADYLLQVIDKTQPQDTGKIFAWDGEEIQP